MIEPEKEETNPQSGRSGMEIKCSNTWGYRKKKKRKKKT